MAIGAASGGYAAVRGVLGTTAGEGVRNFSTVRPGRSYSRPAGPISTSPPGRPLVADQCADPQCCPAA